MEETLQIQLNRTDSGGIVKQLIVGIISLSLGTGVLAGPKEETESTSLSDLSDFSVPSFLSFPVPLSSWYRCGVSLLDRVGDTGYDQQTLLLAFQRYSVNKDPAFLSKLLAVAYTESRFQRGARSEADALGLLQITAIAALEAQTFCRLYPLVTLEDLLNPATNIRYGSCFLDKLLKETGGNLDRALIIYNGGYRQLLLYDAGKAITHQTANYVLHVRRELDRCH